MPYLVKMDCLFASLVLNVRPWSTRRLLLLVLRIWILLCLRISRLLILMDVVTRCVMISLLLVRMVRLFAAMLDVARVLRRGLLLKVAFVWLLRMNILLVLLNRWYLLLYLKG